MDYLIELIENWIVDVTTSKEDALPEGELHEDELI